MKTNKKATKAVLELTNLFHEVEELEIETSGWFGLLVCCVTIPKPPVNG